MIFFPQTHFLRDPFVWDREILTFDIIFYFFATDPATQSHRARDPLPGRDPQLPVARSIVLLWFLSFFLFFEKFVSESKTLYFRSSLRHAYASAALSTHCYEFMKH